MSLTLTTKRLDEIAVISAGDPAPQKTEEFASDGMPFVRMQDVGKHGHTTSLVESKDRVSADTSARLKTFAAGSILIPKSGASIRLNHRAILGIDAHVVSHLAVIQVRPGVNPKFVYYWLCGVDMAKVAHDAHMPSLKLGDLGALTIALPPLPEQKRIVKILDAADELRKLRRQADRRTADLIPAIFHDMFGDPATNPKGWPERILSDVGSLDRGRSRHRPRDAAHLFGGPYPFIQTGDVANATGVITKYSRTYSEAGLQQSRMWPKETLCITIAANIAKTAILGFDACFPDSVVGFIPGNRVDVEYIRAWFTTVQSALEESAPQSAQKNINLKILRELTIPVPPIEAQREFAARVTEVREMEAKQAESLRSLDDLFQSLLHRTFEGEL